MSERVAFKELSEYPKLFLDFVYHFSAVKSFYSGCSVSVNQLSHCVQRVLKNSYPRNTIAQILQRQNVEFGSGKETLENIKKLGNEDSVAVVTGQQVGLFTGPLLTIYKALTAAKLADHLSGLGINAVPVFWMPSEDHDFAEIGKTYFIDKAGSLKKIEYQLEGSEQGRSVGEIRITSQMEERIQELKETLPATEFSDAVFEDLSSSYRAGNTFSHSFARLMARLLKRYGIIFLDPLDKQIKSLSVGIYERALCQAREISERIRERNERLETNGYPLQVKSAKSNTLVFYAADGQRSPVRIKDDHTFLIADEERSREDLVAMLNEAPEKFSPNVLLRPFVQDSLLPTASYVGGPAEIAYYAQVQPLYRFFGSIEPIITPRASFTLLEKRIQRILDKYGLVWRDFLSDFNTIFKKVVENVLSTDIVNLFALTEQSIRERLDQLEKALAQVDPTLVDALSHSRDKMLYQLNNLLTKLVNINAKRDEVAKSHIHKAQAAIYPNKALQERTLNIFSFLVKYGYGLIDRIYEETEIRSGEHKIITL